MLQQLKKPLKIGFFQQVFITSFFSSFCALLIIVSLGIWILTPPHVEFENVTYVNGPIVCENEPLEFTVDITIRNSLLYNEQAGVVINVIREFNTRQLVDRPTGNEVIYVLSESTERTYPVSVDTTGYSVGTYESIRGFVALVGFSQLASYRVPFEIVACDHPPVVELPSVDDLMITPLCIRENTCY